jgi:hypothetical protein
LDQLTAGGVPVYRDSAGVLRERPDQGDVDALRTELAAKEREFTEYGGGFIDYTDNDFGRGVRTLIPADVPTQVMRDLTATAANSRLNRPFAGFAFWDNDAKLVRGRALYDVLQVSMFLRLIPDRIDGVLRVSLQAGAIEIGGKNMSITAAVGSEESIRADFIFPVRNMLLNNGAKVMLTSTVPLALVEFSPEFYPMGYEG